MKKYLGILFVTFSGLVSAVGQDDLNGYKATEIEIADQACYAEKDGGGSWSDSNSNSGSDSDSGGLEGAGDAVGGAAGSFMENLNKGIIKGDGC